MRSSFAISIVNSGAKADLHKVGFIPTVLWYVWFDLEKITFELIKLKELFFRRITFKRIYLYLV